MVRVLTQNPKVLSYFFLFFPLYFLIFYYSYIECPNSGPKRSTCSTQDLVTSNLLSAIERISSHEFKSTFFTSMDGNTCFSGNLRIFHFVLVRSLNHVLIGGTCVVNESQQHQEKILGNGENQSWGCWVRSVNSVYLCAMPPHHWFNRNTEPC